MLGGPINTPKKSLRGGHLIRHLSLDQKATLVRGFVTAFEAGVIETDELLTADQKNELRELYVVIEAYWNGD